MRIISRTVNLDELCRVEPLTGVMFTGEDGGHQFVIRGIMGNAAIEFVGSVTGQFRCPDGTPVELTNSYCDIDDHGVASVTLPGNCYEHGSGPFGIIIVNVDDNDRRTVIYSAAGFMQAGEAASPVDPESIINTM